MQPGAIPRRDRVRVVGGLRDVAEVGNVQPARVERVDEYILTNRLIHDLGKLRFAIGVDEAGRDQHDAPLARQQRHTINDFSETAQRVFRLFIPHFLHAKGRRFGERLRLLEQGGLSGRTLLRGRVGRL